jgi:hypothetical protein
LERAADGERATGGRARSLFIAREPRILEDARGSQRAEERSQRRTPGRDERGDPPEARDRQIRYSAAPPSPLLVERGAWGWGEVAALRNDATHNRYSIPGRETREIGDRKSEIGEGKN